MRDRVVKGSWIDLTFYHVFCRNVVVAGITQGALLFAGYLVAVWFNDYVVTQAYSQGYSDQLIDAAILQFSSLLTLLWSGMVLVGLTVLVARWKGVRWAAQMISLVLVCIVFVGAGFAAYAASKSDVTDDIVCNAVDQEFSLACN